MKKTIIIWMLFFSSLCKSQNTAVTYGLIVEKDEDKKKFSFSNEIYEEAIEGAKNIKYELVFNENNSVFKIKEVKNIEENITISALSEGAVYKDIFIENDSVFSNNRGLFFSENKYLITDPLNKDWEVTNETKKIGIYICYRANTTYVVNNGYGTFRHPVIAWFCPEIISKFGPKGYGGLPGLILELQIRKVIYRIENMEPTDKVFNFDKKGIAISRQTFNELVRKNVKF